jgi:hypothetical protein
MVIKIEELLSVLPAAVRRILSPRLPLLVRPGAPLAPGGKGRSLTMYDAIVVGARCAGGSTAMLLARKGYKVLLVDRDTFPSDVPHGHFSGMTGLGEAPSPAEQSVLRP